MKKICFIVIFVLITMSCFSQNDGRNDEFYIEIDNKRFYLRYSTRSDVEAFLGPPSIVTHYERGGEGFNWNDFIYCFYDNENISFHYNDEGYIIRITIYSTQNNRISLPYGHLNTITFNIIEPIARQTDPTGRFIRQSAITIWKGNFNPIIFSFNDDLILRWVDASYDSPW